MLLCKEVSGKDNILHLFMLATFCTLHPLIPPLPKSCCVGLVFWVCLLGLVVCLFVWFFKAVQKKEKKNVSLLNSDVKIELIV